MLEFPPAAKTALQKSGERFLVSTIISITLSEKHHLRRRDFAVEKEGASSHDEEARQARNEAGAPGTRWTK